MSGRSVQPFLQKYQSNEPLVPYLAQDTFEIIKRLYSFILKEDVLTKMDMKSTLDPSKLENEKFKSHSKISLGFSADQELAKLLKSKTASERDVLAIHLDFQKMLKKIISKIVLKGAIAYSIARDVTCLTSEKMKSEDAPAMFLSLAKHLHSRRWLTADEVDASSYQYSSLRMSVDLPKEGKRLDEFYKSIPEHAKMPALKKVIMIVLTLSHENAEVERGFSVNKEVSVENMAEKTIVAHRLICQFVKDNGNPASVPLNKVLLLSCSGSYQKYKAALAEQRKESKNSEMANAKKRKAEEIKDVASKRKKLEVDIDLLERKADELADEAEKKGRAQQAHDLIVQSNALRKDVKKRKGDLVSLDASLKALQEELDNL